VIVFLLGLSNDLTGTDLIFQEITDDRPYEKITGALITTSNTSFSTTSPDNTILVMKDQLKRARRYNRFLPSRGNHGFVKDLRRRTRDIQQALSGATVDRKLPKKYFFFIRITKFFTLGVYSDDAYLLFGYSFIGSG
jgi:alpha-1,4-galacturonosyltransferase